MINLEDCIEIGHFARPHGYKGQIILKLRKFSFDEVINMEWVFVVFDGLPVPFFIDEFSERGPDNLLVSVEDIHSIEEAEKLVNRAVYLSADVLEADEYSYATINSKSGFAVIDHHAGNIGQFDTLIENDQNPLLRILKGKQEILLPFHEEFLLSIDDEAKEIHVNCPYGLLDLYLE